MKSIAFLFAVVVISASAQAPPATPQTPGSPAPAAAAPLTPDTVIATIDGKKFTYGDFSSYVRGMPPQTQQSALRDRKQFLPKLALMQKLSDLAEKAKLDQSTPYKEAIEFSRINILMQAQINSVYNSFPIAREDEQKYYEQNKARYQQVKLKVIYIPFSASAGTSADGKKRLTEDEAKAKAAQIAKDARSGGDFVKLVEANSEDATSKAKGGDFGTMTQSDNLPESIHNVIFALKEGEVSEPVRQPNGFYIFRAETVSEKPFASVREQIFGELKNTRLKEWLETTTKALNVTYENETFLSSPTLPGLALPPTPK